MQFNEYLNALNHYLMKTAYDNDNERNFVYFISPDDFGKVNIQGEFMTENYYGVDPRLSVISVKKEALKVCSGFSSKEQFENYLDKMQLCYFHMEKNVGQETERALFAKCILATLDMFYFELECELGMGRKNEFEKLLQKNHVNFKTEKTCYRIYGRPSDKILTEIEEHGFAYQFDGRLILHDADRCDWKSLYLSKNSSYFHCKSAAFYSGVIPRLVEVSIESPKEGNNSITGLLLKMGRTTYMTMHGLLYYSIISHPYLDTYKTAINIYAMKEYNAQCIFKEKLQKESTISQEKLISYLNEYLKKSPGIHNINVSGNVITSDGYCIYTKRGKNIEDEGNFYCSVNGGSEINDAQVEFYCNSVEEDLPTLTYESEKKVFFGGELTRETQAELGITNISDIWEYYGLSIMGRIDEKHVERGIWFHFNVLGEKHCSETFEQIYELQKTATEHFENRDIFGYRFNYYQTQSAFLKQKSLNGLSHIVEWSDLIIVIAVALEAALQHRIIIQNETIIIYLQIAIYIFMAILLLAKIITAILKNKHYKEYNFIFDISTKQEKRLELNGYKKLIGKKNMKRADAIFILLFDLRKRKIFRKA